MNMTSAARTSSGTTSHAVVEVVVAVETHVTLRGASAAGWVLKTNGTQSRRILSAGPKTQDRTKHAETGTVMSSGVELIPSVAVTSVWPKGASAVKMRSGINLVAARIAIAAGMRVLPK